ncbi:MAG: bifunctional UDP-N-acetylglucosamine diphosphorylase/glucosamine-1-phosphate N-acetyltransferase GlmU [Nitrospirales bacterium]|nr:bifunctional UDP-N-acetylglucosamine diphosphorylase/glucosamine-1-phosphate N-acetyltransferase GlmU [Nitrospira sp.]MDR4502119.1 bifunctional UDP-N-acetylglucosamine diphosphorylase/glucosamine-1-phosphate N-acetyltransferase GlmU [Nitrospirales bacterium]
MSLVSAVIMAAGQGTRMKSATPKVLHPVAGKPMVWYMASLARRVVDSTVVMVIGHGADQVRAYLQSVQEHLAPFSVVEQTQQLGTGHAVLQTRSILLTPEQETSRHCLILNGDTPLLTEETVRALLDCHQSTEAAVTILTSVLDDPHGYGRVIRGVQGEVLQIVEDRDASDEQKSVKEINVGTYVVQTDFLFHSLESLSPQNVQGEYYLTDIVGIAVKQGVRVSALTAKDAKETSGINNREHLAAAEREMRARLCRHWMQAGVTMLDPGQVSIDAEVVIGCDSVLYPDVRLEGGTVIGENTTVRSHTRITNSIVGSRVTIQDACVLDQAVVKDEACVGPFAHLRPATEVGVRAKVGNFVELKNTKLGEESKVNHLSYLGDTTVGRKVNIGAGTITCNYDGFRKSKTVIEDEVFVGSDTQLIAPVRVGRGAIIAAGTTVTSDVPPEALGISRQAQTNREGAASRKRASQGLLKTESMKDE